MWRAFWHPKNQIFKESARSNSALQCGVGHFYGKEALLKYFKAVAGRERTPGVIAVIQSFGSRINLHPHLHFLVSEGGSDRKGHFHRISRFNDDLLRELFTREVFSLLLRKQLINRTLIQKILRLRHLKLTFMAERPPPQSAQQELLMAAEEREDYL